MKLGIGTAQFGLNYGISNKLGVTPYNEVAEILDFAIAEGCDTIDTAAAYGTAERIIGSYLSQTNSNCVKVVSKFKSSDSFEGDYKTSRALLKHNLYGYLAHEANTLIRNKELREQLIKLRDLERVRVGASVYTQKEIEKLLQFSILDVVQIPLNVLDHRLIKSGILKELKNHNIEIHVRSVFLQGLFFLPEQEISVGFPSAKKAIYIVRQLAKENDLSVSDLALLFVNSIPEVDRFIIGVNSRIQLKENFLSLKKSYNCSITQTLLDELNFDDEKILNPTLWPH